MMTEQVYARAVLMAGDLDEHRQELLRVLCAANASAMEVRLRDDLTAEDCLPAFALWFVLPRPFWEAVFLAGVLSS